MIDFLFERIPRPERPFPNLAQHQADPYTPAWREFSRHWPFSEPVGFFEHCVNHGVPVRAVTVDEITDAPAIYPVALAFFDHTADLLSLVPDRVQDLILAGRVTPVIFYSEGDDPEKISQRLRQQEQQHGWPAHTVHLVSANTVADQITNCTYFADDELLFRHRNRWHTAVSAHTEKRSRSFVCLNRTHKWWRAATMAHMHSQGWLEHAYWSYSTSVHVIEDPRDAPISLYEYPGLWDLMAQFLRGCPYRADTLTSDQHNDHEHQVLEHYRDAYFQIILETHFDADGSGGTFITEKTFKAIKNSQPFVIFGPPGTLAQLRSMGYCTFDSVIDNSYDLITDNNLRWQAVLRTVQDLLQQRDLRSWYQACVPEIQHNQQIFMGDLRPRLNRVLDRLTR